MNDLTSLRALLFARRLPGLFRGGPVRRPAGVIRFRFSAFDRVLWYALKYEKGFIFTHLRTIAPKQEPYV